MKGDFLVKTDNPKALDGILNQLGAVLLGGPENFIRPRRHADCYIVRALPGNAPGFIKFAITNQGYGEVVGDVEEGE